MEISINRVEFKKEAKNYWMVKHGFYFCVMYVF